MFYLKRVLGIFWICSQCFFYSKSLASDSPYHVLAVDIETSGPSMIKHGIVSIGSSVQDQDSHEVSFFQINVSLPEGCIYEENCLQEFWLKNPDAYKFVQQNTVVPKDAIQAFCTFLKESEEKYPELVIVSDNPAFDISWLNYYLDKYSNRLPLNYSEKKEYRVIWDTHSLQKSLLAVKTGDCASNWQLPEKLGFKSKWPYDHNPLNDARTIADFYNQTVKEWKKFSKLEDGKVPEQVHNRLPISSNHSTFGFQKSKENLGSAFPSFIRKIWPFR